MAGFQKGKKKIHIYPSVTSVQCKPGTFSGLVDNAAILSRTVNSCSNYYDQLQNMSVVGALQTLSNPKAIPGLSHITAWTQSFDLCWKWNNKLLILPLSGHSDDTACAGGGGVGGENSQKQKGSRKNKWRATHSYLKENPQLMAQSSMLEWHLGAHKRLLCLQRKNEQGRLWERRSPAQEGWRQSPWWH